MHWSFISIFFNHIIMYIERFYFHTHVKIYTITCFCDFYVTVNPCCPGPAIFNFWSQDNSPQKGAVGVVEFGTGDLRLCGLKQHLEYTTTLFGTSNFALRDHWSCNVATSILLHLFRKIPLRADTYEYVDI